MKRKRTASVDVGVTLSKPRSSRLAICPVGRAPMEHAFVVGVGRLGAVLVEGADVGGARGIVVTEGRAPRDADGGDLECSGTSARAIASAVFAVANAEGCPEEPSHVLVVGEAADAFAAEFLAAFADEFRRGEPGGTLVSLWLLPPRDERPRACHQAARFVGDLARAGGALGAWGLLAPEALTVLRGVGLRSEVLADDSLFLAVLRAFASPRFGGAIETEAAESGLFGFVPGAAIGGSLLVFREDARDGDRSVHNVARLAALGALLDAPVSEAVTVCGLVQLSEKEVRERDARDVERQVKAAGARVAPGSLSTAAVVESVPALNGYHASVTLAVGGAPLRGALSRLLDSAGRWNASSADADAVSAAMKALGEYDARAKRLASHSK